jgi:hypothetical protein
VRRVLEEDVENDYDAVGDDADVVALSLASGHVLDEGARGSAARRRRRG